ncbi:hypothetical protein K439DRAFT_1619566 [Ramaria rubella]|nr:hypothetical protein K439DRAFT_1619566 [Ramaria rubella]
MHDGLSEIIESELFCMEKTFSNYEAGPTTHNGDIWLKSLDPLHLITHGWLMKNYDKPPMMMLIHQHGGDAGIEVGFRLQGILVDKKLPPVHVLEKNTCGMCQYITITDLGQLGFQNSVKVIYALHDLYEKHLKEGVIEEWASATYQSYSAASFSCRYLSPKSHGDAVAINKLVDPLGLLEKCDDQLVYNNTNVVNYYSRGVAPDDGDNSSEFMYEDIHPAISHLGHIVELQVAFYLWPSRTKGHWFFDPTLHSISLIDTSINQALLKIKIDKGLNHKTHLHPPHSLKHVSGIPTLEDKPVELAHKQLHKLAVSEVTPEMEAGGDNSHMEIDGNTKVARVG